MDLVACLHLPVSLSYPAFAGMTQALDWVRSDCALLRKAGFDAVLIENDNDKPHTLTVNEAQVAWLTRAALAAKEAFAGPVGIGVQRIDWRATLAVAAAAELDLVRLDVYVDQVKMQGELVTVDPDAVLAYRKQVRAEHVALWVDVQVKHAELVSTHSLAQSVRLAREKQAAAVLITSERTGTPPAVEDLRTARAQGARVIIGSGLTPENAHVLRPLSDGAVVGTVLKEGDRISYERAKRMVDAWTSASRQ